MNRLYFGDNLDVLRQNIKDESVDLVYLDPPFNSNAIYNVLFKGGSGAPSEAQAEAFRDTWGWGPMAAIAYDEIQRQGGDLAPLTASLRAWLGDCAMMAYLVMMAVRLTELHRTLKDTGTLYLHCDQTASHYLKIILDCIFGAPNYRNELIWKRSNPKSHVTTNFPTCTDTILRYSKGSKWVYHQPYEEHDPEYVRKAYKYKDEGGAYRLLPLLNPNDNRPNLTYEFLGVTRVWRWTRDRMQKAYDEGVVVQLKPGAVPQYKKYLEDSKGRTVTNCWTDIPQAAGTEALGYPTQKPLALLDRIIKASSNEGDVVLDPFCGCGTTVESAAHLKRQWIGIDVTHYAITLIEKRLGADKKKDYEIKGRPIDLAGAHELARRDKYQFQWWAAWLLGVQTYESKKGADRGIDANIYFANGPYGLGRIIISVKGGENPSPVWVRELAGVVEREKAQMGILVTLMDPTRAMKSDASGYGMVSKTPHSKLPRVQIATVQDLLDQRFPVLPPLPRPIATSPRRKSGKERDQLELLFPFEGGGGIVTDDGTFVDPRYIVAAR